MKVLEPELRRQRLLIVGRSGRGKSNGAKGSGVEPILAATPPGRVGVIDPTDSWFGLRKKPDGERDAFKVIIFGGPHGDVPLKPDAGAIIGKALAQSSDSWIISLEDMADDDDRAGFMADFLAALYAFNRAPLTLVVDEADTIAPEKPDSSDAARSVTQLTHIVKRGRKRGFVPWLITQRPADLSKRCTSQADAVIAFSLTLPHDKKAINDYVKDHDEDGTAAAMFKAMPSLPRGEAIVWWPDGNILERRSFPLSKTFDSGKAPEPGDKVVRLKPLKIDGLSKEIDAILAEKEAADPAKLRARIAELEDEKALAGATPPAVVAEDVERARQEGHAEGYCKGLEEIGKAAGEDMLTMQNELTERVAVARAQMGEALAKAIAIRNGGPPPRPNYGGVGLNIESRQAPAPQFRDIDLPAVATRSQARRLQRVELLRSRPVDRPPNFDGTLEKGPRAILTALAQLSRRFGPHVFEPARVGLLAGYSPTSSTFRIYCGKLIAAGYLNKHSDGGLQIDSAGDRAAGNVAPLPTGRAIAAHWIKTLEKGPSSILEAIVNAGGSMSVADVSRATGYSATSSTFRIYTGTLRRLKMINDGKDPLTIGSALK